MSYVRNAPMYDLNELLELINTSDDTNVQVQLFSTLSSYIMSNEVNIDEIITYNCLYDKIGNILSGCPPRQAIVLFNFLSAVLYTVDEDTKRNNLVAYAKNMIRSSGCLATMCEFFTSCIMHQDVWRSLCRCLAESCCNVERNQSYCTHLIPTCIQRCSQRNIEVLLVLQSLLQNNPRNISLFIECNGISLFQREFLQHDICLQLLNTLVQCSKQAIEHINRTDICQYLRDFLHLYGPKSQLGQWATIILYHISGTKGTIDTPILKHQTIKSTPMVIDKPDLPNITETTRFVQNVMNEIIQCSSKNDFEYLKDMLNTEPLNKPKKTSHMQDPPINNRILRNAIGMQNKSSKFNEHKQNNKCISNWNNMNNRPKNWPYKKTDLSFSFLHEEYNKRMSNATLIPSKYSIRRSECSFTVKTVKPAEFCEVRRISDHVSQHDTPELTSFEPKFASTPKKKNCNECSNSNTRLQNSTRTFNTHSTRKLDVNRRVRKRKYVPKPLKRVEQITRSDKENKHRSISGWFFEAVNDSCSTLFKTVKNIFRPKNSIEESKAKCSTSITINSASCSYSFTNYMRKRDAILESNCAKKFNGDFEDFSMEMSNRCITCNDTTVLKEKLAHDDLLKQTIRKLKVGINLYGCDFKKISKQLWPQQKYMTPIVLYNLYRKLILK